MKLHPHFRPTLLSASALLLAACTAADSTPPSATQSLTQQQNAGTDELLRIADTMAANGNHEAAIPLYRQLGQRTGNVQAMNGLAGSLIARGAASEAATVLQTLVTRGQTSGQTWYNLGKAQLALGQFDLALTSFDSAATISPADPKVRSGKAIALAALGRTSEALASFGMGVDRLTLSNKALVLAATGYPDAAIAMLETFVKQGKGTSRDRQNLAMAYLLGGKESEAYEIARLDLDPASINETFTFYRSLERLAPAERMQALVTGTISPQWTREQTANLELTENQDRTLAAQRQVEETMRARAEADATVAAAVEPEPTPAVEAAPEPVDRSDYVLTEVPPLVEPEGWALQIGAYRTIENLMRGWTILFRQSGDLLENIPPRRSEVDFGERDDEPSGFYYRLNAGPLKTFKEAKDLCKALKDRGTSCWIRPPEKTEGKLPLADNTDAENPGSTLVADNSGR